MNSRFQENPEVQTAENTQDFDISEFEREIDAILHHRI